VTVAEAVPGESRPRAGGRLAAAFLFCLMAIGSLVLWTAVPAGCLWLAGELTDEIGTHFLIALPLTVVCVGLFAALLFRVNHLYLRITGALIQLPEDEEDDEEEPRLPRGPLEPMLVGSLVIALAALVVWFFFLAEDPPRHVI
jgi:hypothetical protein